MSALDRLRQTERDLSHPFAAFLAHAEGPTNIDEEIRHEVAEAEAEGAALIGARPCPNVHGWESSRTPRQMHGFSLPCPDCGAVL